MIPDDAGGDDSDDFHIHRHTQRERERERERIILSMLVVMGVLLFVWED
jgi:hypothetical protein